MKQFDKRKHIDAIERINKYRRNDLIALLMWRNNTEFRNYNETIFTLILYCLHFGDINIGISRGNIECLCESLEISESDTNELVKLLEMVNDYYLKYEENPYYFTNEVLIHYLDISVEEESSLMSIHRNVEGYTFYGKKIYIDDFFPMEDDYQKMYSFLKKMITLEIYRKYPFMDYIEESKTFSNYMDDYSNPINYAIYDVMLYEENEDEDSYNPFEED